jgi:hypothetical protein
MKTERLPMIPRQIQRIPQIGIGLLIATSFCPAQDASCKPIADAITQHLRTPYHLYVTQVQHGISTTSEVIGMSSGVFVQSKGAWHKIAGSLQDFAQLDDGDSIKQLRDCRHVSDEVTNGQPSAKYTPRNDASGGDETVWIAKAGGMVIKSEAHIQDRQVVSRYEYSNVQAPSNVH